ncbi:Antiviral helicase ski2 [Glugoides intestinalis]
MVVMIIDSQIIPHSHMDKIPTDVPENHKIEHYAAAIRHDWIPVDYESIVDSTLLDVKFSPDTFQKQAFYFLSKNQSVFVSAHTSSGKTLVAEYAIAQSNKKGSRVVYTSPLKALSNQKFFDFKQKFSDVGLITGDIQVNPAARCLIMTTEIFRNLLYKNADILRDIEFVIFDEVHYINDPERGVVWEECIIMLPKHITIIMLSATIPNSLEFAEWVGRTKKKRISVISTHKRPVPLEFLVYRDANVFSLGEQKKNEKDQPTNFNIEIYPFSKKTRTNNKFRINDLGNFVNNKRLVPAIFFTFSKRACEEHGKSLQLLDLTTPVEKKKITAFLNEAMRILREEDRNLPQIQAMYSQAYRGVAIHHGSLLPFVKECVEILFSENLIKILVATETFAMGVNMPAKCCVFLALSKIDGERFRYLNTGEFIQMSGRAGRRGMDIVGTVLIADPRIADASTIKQIISGIPVDLGSQFKLSFSLILTAIMSGIEVETLMRSSFKEHGTQKSLELDFARLKRLEEVPLLECERCIDYQDFISDLSFLTQGMSQLIRKTVKVGDTVVLTNNAIVTIKEMSRRDFTYVEATDIRLENRLFNIPLNAEMVEKYDKIKITGLPRYPITHKNLLSKGSASLDEVLFLVKDSKIVFDLGGTDIDTQCKIQEMKKRFENIFDFQALQCEDFVNHYAEAIKSKQIIDEIKGIKAKHSNESLAQMTEYRARVVFLKKHLFLSDLITLKGRVAAEIRTVNDVLVTELLFDNQFECFKPAEIVSVFSLMINDDIIEDYTISEELKQKVEIFQRCHDKLSGDLDELGIPSFTALNLSMVQAVYDWCSGKSLGTIVAQHNAQEGAFVRLLLRLDECCREMENVSILIGDEKIGKIFSEASLLMKRDIIFLPSMYI